MTGKKRQVALENTLKKCFNEIMESDSNRGRESTISNVSGDDFIRTILLQGRSPSLESDNEIVSAVSNISILTTKDDLNYLDIAMTNDEIATILGRQPGNSVTKRIFEVMDEDDTGNISIGNHQICILYAAYII